jgi:hypothetical protein
VTEKILHPFAAASLPIYWGSEKVKSDFNKKAFVYANDFANLDSLVEYIIHLDNHDIEYSEIINCPCLQTIKLMINFYQLI